MICLWRIPRETVEQYLHRTRENLHVLETVDSTNSFCRRLALEGAPDGTAVLGLGDIGPEAALPVMEGKACLFKRFGGVDAYPICLNTKDPEEIVRAVQLIAPGFGGINLEDISAPRCFEIEEQLIETLDIPVFHDDQHGTAGGGPAAPLPPIGSSSTGPSAWDWSCRRCRRSSAAPVLRASPSASC